MDQASWIEVVVVRRWTEAEGIVLLDLRAPDGADLPPFAAGAHIAVEIAPGLIRHYSLWNNPRETHRYRIAVLREVQSRGGSSVVHRDFTEGRTVRIQPPRNNFPLVAEAAHSVLVAGGIGITPLLAMAQHLDHDGSSFELHYCVRSRPRAAFLTLLEEATFGHRVRLHCDDGPPEQRFDPVGLEPPRADMHLYLCGPSGFMDWAASALRDIGWPADRLHTEYFSAEISAEGDNFTVEAGRSGKSVIVEPMQSIAAALLAAGIDVPLSCEQGVCGTCLVPVLSGMPDHRDLFQTDEEKAANTHIACCCSRSLSPLLTLDL